MEQFLQQLHEMELFGKIEKGQIGAMLQCLGAVAKDYAKGEFVSWKVRVWIPWAW